jgi:hypothetical protein
MLGSILVRFIGGGGASATGFALRCPLAACSPDAIGPINPESECAGHDTAALPLVAASPADAPGRCAARIEFEIRTTSTHETCFIALPF